MHVFSKPAVKPPVKYDHTGYGWPICAQQNGCGQDLRQCYCSPPIKYTHDGNGKGEWSYLPDPRCSIPHKNKFLDIQRAIDMIARAVLLNKRLLAQTGSVLKIEMVFSIVEIEIANPINVKDSILVFFNSVRQNDLNGNVQGVKISTKNGSETFFLFENYETMQGAIEQALDEYDSLRPQSLETAPLESVELQSLSLDK